MSAQLCPGSPGDWLKDLRQRMRLSQMDLALRVGLSQRHLSCLETGKASPSREMLVALLDGLDASLQERNEVMLAAGFAPVHPHRPLHHSDMGLVNQVVDLMLSAHSATPAMVLDKSWNLLKVNQGFLALVDGLGFDRAQIEPPLNLLSLMMQAGGLADCLINREEVTQEVLKRAHREAVHSPQLRELLGKSGRMRFGQTERQALPPALITRFRSPQGELRFVSTFTTFGTPLDITTESLKIEHLFPADESTRDWMGVWVSRLQDATGKE